MLDPEVVKKAEEILGGPLPRPNTPEFMAAVAQIARKDPALAKQLVSAGRGTPSANSKEIKAKAASVERTLKAQAQKAALRERWQAIRDRVFFRRVSMGGRTFKVPKKGAFLLLFLVIAAGGFWFAYQATNAPQKKSAGVLASGLTNLASASEDALAQEAEKQLGRPLAEAGSEQRRKDLEELAKKNPALAEEIKRRDEEAATTKKARELAQGAIIDGVQTNQGLLTAANQVPVGTPPDEAPGQGQANGQGQTPGAPEAVPPPPVPPPPSASGGSTQEQNLMTLAERQASGPVMRQQDWSQGGGGQGGQGGQGGGGEGGGNKGLILIERNLTPGEVTRASASRTPPGVFLQGQGQSSSTSGSSGLGSGEGGSGQARTFLAERPSGQMLAVAAPPRQAAGAGAPQGFVVLAERKTEASPAQGTPSSGVPGLPPSLASSPLPQATAGAPSPGGWPQEVGAQPGSIPGTGTPQASSLGQTPPLAQASSPSQPSGGQTGRAATGAGQVPGASGLPQAQAGGQGQVSSALPYQPGRFYTGRLNVQVVVVEGGTTPVVIEGADGSIWMGTARLNALGRVEITLDTVYVGGREVKVRAQVFDEDRQLGLNARIEEKAPSLAQDLLRAAATGFGKYVEALSKQTSVVQLPGGAVAQTQQAPPLEYVLLGEAGKLFTLPEERKSLVRVGTVSAGKVVQVMVLGSGG